MTGFFSTNLFDLAIYLCLFVAVYYLPDTWLMPVAKNWTAKISPTSGNPIYERPVVLVIYRDDHKLLLDNVRPRQGAVRADFDSLTGFHAYLAGPPAMVDAASEILREKGVGARDMHADAFYSAAPATPKAAAA